MAGEGLLEKAERELESREQGKRLEKAPGIQVLDRRCSAPGPCGKRLAGLERDQADEHPAGRT